MDIIALFPTIDAFVLVAFFATILLHLVFVRKTKILVDIVSVYLSFLLVVFGPRIYPDFAAWLAAHPLARVLFFIGFVVLFHIIFWRSNIGGFSAKVRPLDIATSVVYRVSVVGLLFATALFFSPASIRVTLGPISTFLFANIYALLIWLAVPFLLAFAYKHKARNGWIR